MNGTLCGRFYAALLAGAQAAAPSVIYGQSGYAPRWEDNLMTGLPLAGIAGDFGAGAGRELGGKLRAAHSSAALAVNSFGRWRCAPDSLRIAGVSGFRSIRFEATFPTGLGGTPPHLDLYAEGDLPVAVESKCTEWMTRKPAAFSLSYDRLRPSHGRSPWFEQMLQLRATANRYQYLDAGQLVKHAFGLMNHYGSREVRLVYLYWEPANAEKWPECRRHRLETEDLAAKVPQSNVRLVPMSYRELWKDWEDQSASPGLKYLKIRYGLSA